MFGFAMLNHCKIEPKMPELWLETEPCLKMEAPVRASGRQTNIDATWNIFLLVNGQSLCSYFFFNKILIKI